MISIDSFGWPQWVLICLIVLEMLIYTVRHGQPRSEFNAVSRFIDSVFLLVLLAFGGFFK